MRAVSRLGMPLLAAGLALAPAMALAQQAPPPPGAPPDSVGPKALQDFSLNGTVTRPADQPVAQPATPPAPEPRAQPPVEQQPAPKRSAQTTATAPAPKQVQTATAKAAPKPEAAPTSAPTVLPDAASDLGAPSPAPIAASAPSFAPGEQPPGVLAPGHSFPMLAWLLAALAAVLGGGLLFWRNHSRHAFAGSTQFDLFAAPEPSPEVSPAPRPAPAQPPAPAPRPAAPATTGVVSTSLRPWIEIGFQPLRCVLQDTQVAVEFEIELFNSGNGPARAVLVEARLFNASPDQDAEIGEFFANPVALGERIPVIPPLQRLAVKSRAVIPRDQVLAYELGGRHVFVPLIAFNALYSWSGREGQTSAGYLLGRDTKTDKVAPFRLDLGPHIFRGLASRLLPSGVRK